MMKKFHLGKATDLYDCGTATFGIAKGNIQSVLTLAYETIISIWGQFFSFSSKENSQI
jgi:hypothetical protein